MKTFFRTLIACFACVSCVSCTGGIDLSQAIRLVTTSPSAIVAWETKIDCLDLEIDRLQKQIPLLDNHVYLPCHSFPVPSIIELDAATGQLKTQKNYHNVFELWATDRTLNIIHGDTSLTALDNQGNIVAEITTRNRNMRSGFPHGDRFYIFADNDFRFDVFSFANMQIVDTDTSTVIVDSNEKWQLGNRGREILLIDSQTNKEEVIGTGTFIWGYVHGNNIWVWSKQNGLQLFNSESKRVVWQMGIELGNFTISETELITYQDGTVIVRNAASLVEIASFDLLLNNNEEQTSPIPEVQAIATTGKQILLIYNSAYIASITYSADASHEGRQ